MTDNYDPTNMTLDEVIKYKTQKALRGKFSTTDDEKALLLQKNSQDNKMEIDIFDCETLTLDETGSEDDGETISMNEIRARRGRLSTPEKPNSYGQTTLREIRNQRGRNDDGISTDVIRAKAGRLPDLESHSYGQTSLTEMRRNQGNRIDEGISLDDIRERAGRLRNSEHRNSIPGLSLCEFRVNANTLNNRRQSFPNRNCDQDQPQTSFRRFTKSPTEIDELQGLEKDLASFRDAPYAYPKFDLRIKLKSQRIHRENTPYMRHQRSRSLGPESSIMRSQSPGRGGPIYRSRSPGFKGPNFRSRSPGARGPNFRSQSPGPGVPNFRSRSPGFEGPNFRSRSPGPGGPDFRSRSPGPGGSNFRSRSPGPSGSNFRSRSSGPGGSNFRSLSPGPTGSNFRSRSPGPSGSNFRSQSPGTTGSNFRSRSPGLNGSNFRSRSPGPGGYNFRSRSPAFEGPNFKSRSPAFEGPNFRSRSPGPGGPHFRSRSPGPGGPNYRSQSTGLGGANYGSRSPGPNFRARSPGPGGPNYRSRSPGFERLNFRSHSPGPRGPKYRSRSSRRGGPCDFFVSSRWSNYNGNHHYNNQLETGGQLSRWNRAQSCGRTQAAIDYVSNSQSLNGRSSYLTEDNVRRFDQIFDAHLNGERCLPHKYVMHPLIACTIKRIQSSEYKREKNIPDADEYKSTDVTPHTCSLPLNQRFTEILTPVDVNGQNETVLDGENECVNDENNIE